jgi:antitoxin component of MazEF toxin-antitoxin module
MVKKLTKTGNRLALVLDRPLLDELHIDADTSLEVSTDGRVIVLTPVREAKRETAIKRAADQIFSRYAGVFRKLAA